MSGPLDGYGLDRVSLSFPVRDYEPPAEWHTVTQSNTGGGQRLSAIIRADKGDEAHAGAAVMVGVAQVGEQVWAKVEANPSRLRDPGGCSLLPVGEFALAVEAMWAVARRWVDPACDVDEARVRRLDVARDFRGVAAPAFFVRGLLNVRRPHARRAFLYADPAKGNAETLFAGSNSGGVRLYDQHSAYGDRGAPEGSLRWELEARRDWLAGHGVERVTDVDPWRLEEMARARWEWSRMGTEVTGAVNVVEVLAAWVRQEEITQTRADRLLGMLVRESVGVAGKTSKQSAAEYNVFKDRLGVVPSAELFAGECDVTVKARLDWDSGREVAA